MHVIHPFVHSFVCSFVLCVQGTVQPTVDPRTGPMREVQGEEGVDKLGMCGVRAM